MPSPLVPSPRAGAVAGAAGLLVMLVLGVLCHGDDHGFAIDNTINDWIHRHFDVYARHDLVQTTNPPLVVGALAVIALAALVLGRWDLLAVTVLAPIVAVGLTEYVLKPLFHRTNPAVLHMTGAESEAYPSGHDTAVSVVLVILAVLLLRHQVPLLARIAGLVILTGYFVVTVLGLVGQYYHYASDTIGALGVAVAVVLALALGCDQLPALRRRRRRARARPTTSRTAAGPS